MAVGNELLIIIRAQDLASDVIGNVTQNLSDAKTQMMAFNSEVAAVTRTLGLVTAAAAYGVARAWSAMLDGFEDMESALAHLHLALEGVGEEDLELLGSMLIRISKTLPVSLTDLISLAEEVAKLGVRGRETTEVLDDLTEVTRFAGIAENFEAVVVAGVKFAEASGMVVSAADAIRGMGKIAVAFDLPVTEVERIGSVLTTMALTTPARFEEMIEETQKLGAMAKMFGLTMPEAASMIAQIISYGNVAGRSALRLYRILQLLVQGQGAIIEQADELAGAYSLEDSPFIQEIFSNLSENVAVMAEEAERANYEFAQTAKLAPAALAAFMEERPLEFLKQYAAFTAEIPERIKRIGAVQSVLGWMSTYWMPFVEGMSEAAEGTRAWDTNLKAANESWEKGTGLTEAYNKVLDTYAAQQKIVEGNIETTSALIGEGLAPAFRDFTENILVPFSSKLVDIAQAFRDMRREGAETGDASRSWTFEVLEARLEGISNAIEKALLEGDYKPALGELTVLVGAAVLMVESWGLAAAAIVTLRSSLATELGGMTWNIGKMLLIGSLLFRFLPEETLKALDEATDKAAEAVEGAPLPDAIKDALQTYLDKLGEDEWVTTITLGITWALAAGAWSALMTVLWGFFKTGGFSVGDEAAFGLERVFAAGMVLALAVSVAMEVGEILKGEQWVTDLALKLSAATIAGGITFVLAKDKLAAYVAATLAFTLMPTVEEVKQNPGFLTDLVGKLTAALGAYGIAFALTKNQVVATIAATAAFTFMPDVSGILGGAPPDVSGLAESLSSSAQKAIAGALSKADLAKALTENWYTLLGEINKSPQFREGLGLSQSDLDQLGKAMDTAVRETIALGRQTDTTTQDIINYWAQAMEEIVRLYPGLRSVLETYIKQFSDAGRDAAHAFVDALDAGLGSVTVTSQVTTNAIAAMQTGGPVPGVGSGDIVPAMLEPGEFVVPKWMMRIPWLSSLIAGVWSGARGYQEGGAVGAADIAAVSESAAREAQAEADRVASERERLERELLRIQGDTLELRRLELEALHETNRELQERIWQLQDDADVMREREQLEMQLLRMQEDTAAIRAIELAGLHESNQALQEQIWALEDAKRAADEAAEATRQQAEATRELFSTIESAVGIVAGQGSYLPQLASIGTSLATGDYVGAGLDGLRLLADVAKDAAQEIEQAVGQVTSALRDMLSRVHALAQSFLNLITQSQQLTDVQRTLAQVQSLLIDTLLGFLSPIRWVIEFVLGFFEDEAEDAAEDARREARRATASLNIPTGYKLERAAWGVAAPGQPWGMEEDDWQDTEKKLKDVFDNVPKWLKEIMEGFRAALEEAGQGIKAFIEKMQEIWKELAPVIIEALLPVLRYFGEALGWVADQARSILLPVLTEHLPKILWDLGRAFSDLLASGLVVLSGFIADVAVPVIGTFAEALAGAANWIRTVLVSDLLTMFAAIGNWWRTEVDPFLKGKVFPKLQEWFMAIYDWIATELMPFLENEVWPFLKGPVWDAIVDGLTMLGNVFMDIWNVVKDKWPQIKDWIVNKIREFFEGIASDWQIGAAAYLFKMEGLGSALDYIWTTSSLDLWTKVKLSFALGLQTFEGQMTLLGLALIGIGALFSSPVTLIIGGIMAVVGFLGLLAGGIWNAIQGIGGILLQAADLILLPVKIAMNGLIWIVNAVISAINWALGWAGVNIPSIPYLEKGGHVLEEGLAYLHRGETVVPARASPYGGQSITIQQMTVVANDPEEFMEKMEAAIRRKNLRGTGQRYGSYATAGA